MLKNSDIYRLVNQYIGVSDGYLGDFSYRTHDEFYPDADAEILLRERGANNSVDRIDTALHGYTKSICSEADLTYDENDSLTKLFSTIYSDHPAFDDVSHSGQIRTILRSQAGAINTINTIRNNAAGPSKCCSFGGTGGTIMARFLAA
jgi:hypothetical protein